MTVGGKQASSEPATQRGGPWGLQTVRERKGTRAWEASAEPEGHVRSAW